MENNSSLEYLKSLDGRMARMEVALSNVLQRHQEDDDRKHGKFTDDIQSLKNSRLATRIVVGTGILGGGGSAVKMGWASKIALLLSSASQ